MKTHYLLLLTGLLLTTGAATAQTTPGGVRIGAAGPPDAKAILDLSATGKGLLIPRMDSVTRVGIGTPPDGLMVFQTNGRTGFWYATGGSWLFIPDKARAGDNLGSHTATRNLNLQGNKLVGGTAASPGTVGLSVSASGLVRLVGTFDNVNYNNGVGLHLQYADAGLLVRTNLGLGSQTPPVSGSGDRLMWLSFYSAFRAGGVAGTEWDLSNIGFYSTAFGYGSMARGNYSVAAGYGSSTLGAYSTALGYKCSTAAAGSVALGFNSRTAENYSVAIGYLSKAQAQYAVVLGARSVANGEYSVSLGYKASSAARSGSFTAADFATTDSLRSTTNNQFSTRYVGGYRLFTNPTMTVGVQLAAGGNSWTIISDSTKKERRVLADGNAFLERINRLRLGSWNYIGQSPDSMRHYGPMAQDFYAAFGHDGVGRSGNATGINQADFDGVNLIAIQALYRRVLTLEATNARLQDQVKQLQARQPNAAGAAPASTAAVEERLRRLEALFGAQAQR